MKNLFLLVLLAAGVALFFHDKQQTEALSKAQSDNATLTDQMTALQAKYNALAVTHRQFTGFSDGNPAQPGRGPSQSGLKTDHLQGSGDNPLDRAPY